MLKFLAKLIFRKYEAERREATSRIVARFARGNIRAQNGDFLTEAEALELRDKGDKAVKKIKRAFAKA